MRHELALSVTREIALPESSAESWRSARMRARLAEIEAARVSGFVHVVQIGEVPARFGPRWPSVLHEGGILRPDIHGAECLTRAVATAWTFDMLVVLWGDLPSGRDWTDELAEINAKLAEASPARLMHLVLSPQH